MGDDQNTAWLPPGWTVNVKVRSYGRKDKYYIHPSNGLKFSSKAEVLRYLKSSQEARKPKKRNKVDIERTAAENLPPGWIKELRIKKKGRSIRKDPFYIDPVTGRYFNSLQGVYRYLQSDDSGQTESIEQNHITAKLEDFSHSSSVEPKELRSIGKKEDKIISRRKKDQSEVKLGGGSVVSTVESVNVAKNNNEVEQKEECDFKTLEVSDTLQPVSRAERYAYRMRRREEVKETTIRESVGEDHRLKSGSRVVAPKKAVMQKETYVEQKVREEDMAGGLPNKLQKVTGTEYCEASTDVTADIVVFETHRPGQRRENSSVREGEVQQENVAPQNKKKNMNRKFRSELPRRTSKRLANVEADTSLEITPSRRPRVTARSSDKVEIITTETNSHIGPSGDVNINITGQNGYFEEPNEQPAICKYPTCRKEQELLVRSLFEDLSCIEDLDSVSVDNEDEKAAGKLVDDDPTLENLFTDPCYEFAIKTLTGDIPIEDLNKVGDNNPVCSPPDQAPACSSAMPPNNIWGDPTFEFAVKMLTSDLPAKEPVNSSGASVYDNVLPPNPRSANSSNLFSGFDPEKKPCVRQEGLRDPPSLPHAVYGQARKFGGL